MLTNAPREILIQSIKSSWDHHPKSDTTDGLVHRITREVLLGICLKKKDIRAIHLLAFFPSRAFSAALCASSSDRRLSSSDMNDSSATSAQSFKSGKMDSHVISLPDASSCLRKISVSLDEWKLWVPRLNRIHLLGMMNACRKFCFNPSMLRRFYHRTYQKVWCTEPSETRKTVWVIG